MVSSEFRTSMTVSGQAPVTYTYDHNARLRTITQAPLNPVDLQYDAANRRTLLTLPNGVSTEYQYDGASRLIAMIYRNTLGPLGDLTYQYNAAGNRISVGGSFARTLVPDAVHESSGGSDASYLRTLGIDEALLRTDATDTVHYLAEALGSAVALTNPGGAVATTYSHEPFGRTEVTGTPSSNVFRFTGREDDGTGLYYYRARYYDPGRGRFVSSDPIGLRGGDINLYAFVANSPLNLIDPSGLDFRPGPRGYGGPWKPNGIPHSHPILPGGGGGTLVNPNEPGILPGTNHDQNPLEGRPRIKCDWFVMRNCMASAPNPTTVWNCYVCDQARVNTGNPAITIPACLQCAGNTAAKYGECFTRACGVGKTDSCGKCR